MLGAAKTRLLVDNAARRSGAERVKGDGPARSRRGQKEKACDTWEFLDRLNIRRDVSCRSLWVLWDNTNRV